MNITKDYITPNPYSRPQDPITKVKGIVIHWVANPNTSAKANRNFFDNRKSGNSGYGSAHYIVGQVGEILQCMPTTEIAYHVGSSTYTSDAKTRLGSYPNAYTLGIECCHTDWEGHMTDATYNSVVDLTAYLLKEFGLGIDDIWTHQEVVGWKDCHRLFYKNPSLYQKFKDDVAREMNGQTETSPVSPPTNVPATYTIKAGDTLWGIANRFNLEVSTIEALNPNINVRALQIGQTIKLTGTAYVTHTMQAGDTLWSISREYNVTVEDLKRLNPNLDVTAIPIGTVINIKPKTVTTAPTETVLTYDLPKGVFGFGSRGEDVKKIQNALNKLNFKVAVVDGIYGNDTRNAVYRFQTMYSHLTNDGVYGNATREQMLKELNK